MDKKESCQGCEEKDDCKLIYKELGQREGPSVVYMVLTAFLLPIVVFIISLLLFENLLSEAIEIEGYRTGLSFFLALGVTSIAIFAVKLLIKFFGQSNKSGC